MNKESKAPIKVKNTVDKTLLIQAIRKRLSEVELPKEIQLEVYAKITNVPLFFESHLCSLEHQSETVSQPCAERLKKALSLIGIDIREIAKSIKK